MDRILKILQKVLIVVLIVLVIATLVIYVIKSSKTGPTGSSSNQTGSTGPTGSTGSTGSTGVPTGCQPISGPTGPPNSFVPTGIWSNSTTKYKFQACPSGPTGCLDITNYNDNTPIFRGRLLGSTYTNINSLKNIICPANANFDNSFTKLVFDDDTNAWTSTIPQIPCGSWYDSKSNRYFMFILNSNNVWFDIFNLNNSSLSSSCVLENKTLNSVGQNMLGISFPGSLGNNTITWKDNSSWNSISTSIKGVWQDIYDFTLYTFQNDTSINNYRPGENIHIFNNYRTGENIHIFNHNTNKIIGSGGLLENHTYSFNFNNNICSGVFDSKYTYIKWSSSAPFFGSTWRIFHPTVTC